MINSGEGVSDLLFAVGQPPLIERFGVLEEFEVNTGVLDATQVREVSAQLMGDDEQVKSDFKNYGSCDCSYSLSNEARFRVNVFKQNGQQAIVMRRLQTEIPTLQAL